MVTFNALNLGFKADKDRGLKEEGGNLTSGREGRPWRLGHGGAMT
jgi:hypothetical protein